MRELHTLSAIGFGGYRITQRSAEHRAALIGALRSGCTLIDTASNYAAGESEQLIGAVLDDFPDFDPFVVTKAGYVGAENLDYFHGPGSRLAASEIVKVSDDSYHCLHPDFLRAQIDRSLANLRRKTVDGFLLHNPEYHFRTDASVYDRIERAFCLLEEKVAAGTVRYYGVSSNTLAPRDRPDALQIDELLKIAARVAANHHFRLVQFPFNLLEFQPATESGGRESLIGYARRNGLRTFANRPLNARIGARRVRLARTDASGFALDRDVAIEGLVATLDARLAAMEIDGSAADIPAIRHLRERWADLDTSEIVADVFEKAVYPAVALLFDGDLPDHVRQSVRAVEASALRSAQSSMNAATLQMRDALAAQGVIRTNDDRALDVIACDSLLKAKVDHVLVGMRRPAYVDSLSGLF